MLLPSFFLFQLSAALTSTSQTSSLHDTTQPTTNENSAETVYIATNGDGGSTTTTTSPRVNSTHSGDFVLHNAHFLAVDFSQFSNLTDIEGRLIIESSTLRNLEFLKNIQQINTAKAVGDAMIIRCNIFTENLTSILPNLKQIHSHKGLALRIEDNYNQALTKKEEQRLEKLFSKNMIISDASQEAKIEKNGKKNKGMDSLSFSDPPLLYVFISLGIILLVELLRCIFGQKRDIDSANGFNWYGCYLDEMGEPMEKGRGK